MNSCKSMQRASCVWPGNHYYDEALDFDGTAEVREIQFGDLSIAFSEINYCLFILFKFGRLSWADAPYEPRLHKRKFDYYEFAAGSGIPLNICISDTSNGQLVAMRSMGLGTTFSNGLHQACREIQAQSFNEKSYDWMIRKSYNSITRESFATRRGKLPLAF